MNSVTYRDLFNGLLALADILHIRHWFDSKSYSEHKLLKDAYKELRDGVDSVAEHIAEAGLHNQQVQDVSASDVLGYHLVYKEKESIQILTQARTLFETIRASLQDDNTLASMIDSIDEGLVSVIYKLKLEYQSLNASSKASKIKKVSASKSKIKQVKALSDIEEVNKLIKNKLKQAKIPDSDYEIEVSKREELVIIHFTGHRLKASGLVEDLNVSLYTGWVAYVESVLPKEVIIYIERG